MKVREGRIGEITEILAWSEYHKIFFFHRESLLEILCLIVRQSFLHKQMNRYEFINDVILDHLDDEIKSTDRSGVWRYLISFKVSSSTSFLSIKRSSFFRTCCVPLRTLGLCLCMGSDTSALATSPSRISSSLHIYFKADDGTKIAF